MARYSDTVMLSSKTKEDVTYKSSQLLFADHHDNDDNDHCSKRCEII